MYQKIRNGLKGCSSLERKKTNEYFFKTGNGEYGEGDIFIGVRVPDLRRIAKQFSDISFENLKELKVKKEILEVRKKNYFSIFSENLWGINFNRQIFK